MKKTPFLVYAELFMTSLFWAGMFIISKIVVKDVEPLPAAAVRFTVATVSLIIYFVLSNRLKDLIISKHNLPMLLILGFTGIFGYNIFYLTGLKYTTAIKGSLIIAINPIITSMLSSILLKEKLKIHQVAGIFLSFFGVVLAVTEGTYSILSNFKLNMGDGIVFIAVLFWASYTTLGKRAMADNSPLVSVTYSCIFGCVMLWLTVIFGGIKLPWGKIALHWKNFLYMGLFATSAAFIMWYRGINQIGASRAAIFSNIIPINTLILASVFLKEKILICHIFALIMILSGVYLTNSKKIPHLLPKHNKETQTNEGR